MHQDAAMNESMNESSSVLIGEKSIEHNSQNSKLSHQQKESQVQIKKVILQSN